MRIPFAVIPAALACTAAFAGVTFPGSTRSEWKGYPRYDFAVAERKVTVVAPHKPTKGRPWLWRGEFFGAFPMVDEALLARGWHVVYMACPDTFGSPDTMRRWEQLYDLLVGRGYRFDRRPVLLGMSRGGLYVYHWAALHPDKTGLIYGDAPVCDVRSWPGGKGKGKSSPRDWKLFKEVYGLTEQEAGEWKGNPIDVLEPIARARIPIIHVAGDADDVVPIDENTLVLERRYRALGGEIKVIVKPGVGHHPHSLADPAPIVEFIEGRRLKGR
jgi:pimeloyl-ACP methyl ester carboxylesterase